MNGTSHHPQELAGKVALITGGASGIGRALAEEFARRGGEVVLADRQVSAADEVAGGIRGRGGRAEAVDLDVRDAAAFLRVAKDVQGRAGHVDYLFNNAGIAVGGEVSTYSQADWDDVIDVNLRGVIHGIQAVYPMMIEHGSGHIVNTASMAGLIPSPGTASYVATKHAVVGLTRTLRTEAARHGVRASVLCPGAIRTPILTGGRYGRVNQLGATEEQILRQWERVRPMPPDLFARRTLDAVLCNQAIIIQPSWWRAFWYLERLSPWLADQLRAALYARMRAELQGGAQGRSGQ